MARKVSGKEKEHGKEYEKATPDAGGVFEVFLPCGKIVVENVGFFVENPFFNGKIQGAAGCPDGNHRKAGD